MSARLQIVNWRQCGDDESYVSLGVYPDGDDTSRLSEIEDAHAAEYEDSPTTPPLFVNDDITLQDGEILEHNGRKFRLRLEEEVTE